MEKHYRSIVLYYVLRESTLFLGVVVFFLSLNTQGVIGNRVFHTALLRLEKHYFGDKNQRLFKKNFYFILEYS